ncbi:MAG: SMC-Scp complex subunit ScpB [Planctomycetaceae bacterium]
MSTVQDGPPFQTIDSPAPMPANGSPTEFAGAEHSDAEWTLAALEDAYQRAVESVDAATALIESVAPAAADASPDSPIHGSATVADGPLSQVDAADAVQLEPQQVLEALLFVGGEPLTGRRLADLLGGEHMHGLIDEFVGDINARYADQCRPYQVVLGEGGYRLALRPEFEVVRHRVYGLGPRDVRLSQDALEALALVAYQQPVTRAALEATGKINLAGHLRQLLRLELIALERGDGGKDDVSYRTTRRFLQLFALERLEDLPQPEDLMFR